MVIGLPSMAGLVEKISRAISMNSNRNHKLKDDGLHFTFLSQSNIILGRLKSFEGHS